ncbi:MAG: asparagine synthase (glutamine-hydrolyzing) [Gemmatimonadaceae bacterium]
MCGIAGLVGHPGGLAADDATLERMCAAIQHRGPDDEGHFVGPGVALGMRRLSIIDIAGGRQPIGNEDGAVQVVFNGEIYNHRGLQSHLERAGHRFRSHSDTEALVHLYEERGDDLVRELNGMFAFAIWDTRQNRLLLARDRMGIKPLYYWSTSDGLVFASELRALLALTDFPRDIDPDAVAQYLAFGYVPDPLSIFSAARKLPPGHTLSWTVADGVRLKRYWTPVCEEARDLDETTAVETLRRLLSDAVASHLESEVPLGAFLSGGVDSSTVVALMARELDRPVRTFSIGFDEPEFNEAADAAFVARDLGTHHTELIVRPDVDEWIGHVIRCFDEPFADSSALPTFLVSKLARQQVTVALSGDGGDELFCGYSRYAEILNRAELPPTGRQALRTMAALLPFGALGRNRLLDLGRTRRGRYAATVASALDVREGGPARTEVARRAGGLDEILARPFREAMSRDFTTQMSIVDMLTYLPGDILTKVDRTSMAVSLETRVPLLDHRLVEFAASLPGALKLRDGTGKWILRRAIDGLVPLRSLEKRKQGFGVPLARWFRRELRHRVEGLLSPDNALFQWLDLTAVRRLTTEHLSGRRDHSFVLWRLLVLELWIAALEEGALARSSASDDWVRAEVSRARIPHRGDNRPMAV